MTLVPASSIPTFMQVVSIDGGVDVEAVATGSVDRATAERTVDDMQKRLDVTSDPSMRRLLNRLWVGLMRSELVRHPQPNDSLASHMRRATSSSRFTQAAERAVTSTESAPSQRSFAPVAALMDDVLGQGVRQATIFPAMFKEVGVFAIPPSGDLPNVLEAGRKVGVSEELLGVYVGMRYELTCLRFLHKLQGFVHALEDDPHYRPHFPDNEMVRMLGSEAEATAVYSGLRVAEAAAHALTRTPTIEAGATADAHATLRMLATGRDEQGFSLGRTVELLDVIRGAQSDGNWQMAKQHLLDALAGRPKARDADRAVKPLAGTPDVSRTRVRRASTSGSKVEAQWEERQRLADEFGGYLLISSDMKLLRVSRTHPSRSAIEVQQIQFYDPGNPYSRVAGPGKERLKASRFADLLSVGQYRKLRELGLKESTNPGAHLMDATAHAVNDAFGTPFVVSREYTQSQLRKPLLEQWGGSLLMTKDGVLYQIGANVGPSFARHEMYLYRFRHPDVVDLEPPLVDGRRPYSEDVTTLPSYEFQAFIDSRKLLNLGPLIVQAGQPLVESDHLELVATARATLGMSPGMQTAIDEPGLTQ
jgi:hypothetical protein